VAVDRTVFRWHPSPVPRKLPPLIRRVDHHYFHGYCVVIKRRSRQYEQYFHDQGDAQAALARATRFRDRLLATLPPPRKFHLRGPTRTGHIGVTFRDDQTRHGKGSCGYRAGWSDEKGRPQSRSFSFQKYGRDLAFALAVDTRTRMIEELLRPPRPNATPLIPPRRKRPAQRGRHKR
jgi:hypothetical protein